MQTVNGNIKMYQPAQKPATGKAANISTRNHTAKAQGYISIERWSAVSKSVCQSVLLTIRDIFVRIWILGSVPLTNGSGADPRGPKTYGSRCGFGSGTLVHLHHSSKIKVINKSQTLEMKVFLTIFAYDDKDPDTEPDPYLWLADPNADPGDPKTYLSYGSGSATLLPMHWQ